VEDHISQENYNFDQINSDEREQKLQRNIRSLQLKWFIKKEHNRLKKKLLNCRLCGTNSRFLSMQISLLRAEKQKLLKETSILRATKDKLINEIESIQSNVLLE